MDHSATTHVDKEVLEEMLPFFIKKFGNPSSLHAFGRETHEAIELARSRVAKSLGAKEEEIYFTSGGTEADNLALKGLAFKYLNEENKKTKRGKKKKIGHIITSSIEHPAILNVCKYLETLGIEVTYLPVDNFGLVDLEKLENSIREDTFLISIMTANNEIGTIQPIEEIGKIAKKNNIKFHTDAVQAFGKVNLDMSKLNVDLLSISGHKIYGPKGVGALYVRKGVELLPILHGGGHEHGIRSGTENVPGIVGLGKACELAQLRMDEDNTKLVKMRDALIKGVLEGVENSHLNGHPTKRLPNNAHFRFDYIEGEGLILNLDLLGIAASTGSACSQKALKPSHVLTAIGLKHEEAHGSLRLTLGRENTMDEVQYVIDGIKKSVNKLRLFSPLSKETYESEMARFRNQNENKKKEVEACTIQR